MQTMVSHLVHDVNIVVHHLDECCDQLVVYAEAYASPKGCWNYLSYLARRIWDAIKSIFGSSIAQKTCLFFLEKAALINQKIDLTKHAIKHKIEKKIGEFLGAFLKEYYKDAANASPSEDTAHLVGKGLVHTLAKKHVEPLLTDILTFDPDAQ